MMELKTGDVCRELKLAADGDAGTFEGYGAVFGNVDSYGDVIVPGAFSGTLSDMAKSARKVPMLLDHGFSAGGVVIGVWEQMAEDGTGLRVKGRLLDTAAGRDTHVAMKAGALDGLSIGYRVKEYELRTRPEDPKRKLKAVDLVEVSVVAIPANPQARVSAVKAAVAGIRSIREFESFLRDEGGFSAAEAKRLAGHGWKALEADRDDGGSLDEVAELLRRNINAFKGI